MKLVFSCIFMFYRKEKKIGGKKLLAHKIFEDKFQNRSNIEVKLK